MSFVSLTIGCKTCQPHQDEFVPLITGEILSDYEIHAIQSLVNEKLPIAAHATVKSLQFVKTLHRTVFDLTYRRELAKIGRMTQIRRVLKACVVRQVILNEHRPLPHLEELQTMPFFNDISFLPKTISEVNCLRRFMRAIQALHDIGLPGANNKQNYLEIATMLEGSNRTYALGGAPSKATIRRTVIFHVVTGVPLSKRTRYVKQESQSTSDPSSEEDEWSDPSNPGITV
jgi:hypothetical protein